ncbi:predicted protein [Sclerotinia sclerotiorum 1980 UF-70]|uniref:Uncharacterized protein n=2 Tax=Sclerotinia sclerotiorum (strain ATCC 18683 / 1980 / Ss-1) TaxID=665079 RepID=A7EP25_SCLS1|nr:predicted protein [Sclerotinia sclerotiorum 1980 UF-70]APA10435.1 hypothetical protein sscle_06g052050 [Sclerotinia sclerotiorum 1980 UF-70]EDO04591.1 predicted protein [Sclerotinia sclerotiorum 1980 UF-70]
MKPPTYSTRSKRKSDEVEPCSPTSKKSRTSQDLPPSSPLSSPSSTSADALLAQSPMDSENLDLDSNLSFRGGFRGRARGRGRIRGTGRVGRIGNAKIPMTKMGGVDINASVAGGKSSRGRGGHRVKKSSNARIQSLYHRKQLLKTQYKQVALLQRVALDVISDKSLQAMSEDPKYHETLPEYQIVTDQLAAKYAERVALLEAHRMVQLEYAEKQRLLGEGYTRGVYETRVELIKEKYDLMIKRRLIEEHQQMEMRSGADSPSQHNFDHSHIKRIPEEIFIHPADAWANGGRAAQLAADAEKAQGRKRGGRGKKSTKMPASPFKPLDIMTPDDTEVAPKKTSLYQPATSLSLATTVDGDSAAPTPAELTEQEDADELETDKFGVYIPNKARPRNGDPPNNRIVVEPPFTFDEDEIGIRHHHYKKYNKNDLPTFIGMDPSPQPKNFHYDPWVRNHHSTNNRPEDLDQTIVETHKLHPTLGLPVKGSINPTLTVRSDWSKPVAETKPVVFVVETQDEESLKPRFETSRSAWMARTEREFADLIDQLKMAESLEAIGLRDPILRPIEKRVEPEIVGKISDSLIQAVTEASNLSSKPLPPVSSLRATSVPGTPAPAQRTQGYDPVRDTGYSPHLRRSPVKTFNQVGNLGILADAAEIRGAPQYRGGLPHPIIPAPRPMPQMYTYSQPEFYRPGPSFVPPPTHMNLPPPLPMTLPPPQPQQQQTQFFQYAGPPQAPGGPHNKYKEILPAPPQRRVQPTSLAVPRNNGFNPFVNGTGYGSGTGRGP